MSEKYNIAVVGATGNVGREILKILEQREFPINNIYCFQRFPQTRQVINNVIASSAERV